MSKRTGKTDVAALLGDAEKAPEPTEATPSSEKTVDPEADIATATLSIDPDRADYGDERVVAALEQKKREERGLREDQRTPGQMLRDMTPEQRHAVFQTYQVEGGVNYGSQDPQWINLKAVPSSIHLHWLEEGMVANAGMRGYRKVKLTPETQKWVPNAIQIGSGEFIHFGKYFLGWKDADVYLEEEIRRYRLTNRILETEDETFRSMLQQVPGLRIPRGEGTGIVATRGPDPGSPSSADTVEVEE